MGGSLADLIVNIVANTKQFDGDIDKAKKSITAFNKDLESFGKNMTKYATVPILAIGTAMVKTAIDIEKQKTAFGVLLKDTEKGNKLFTDLQQLASKTPLQLDSITKSAQQLLASGSDLNSLNETITMLGDIALGDAQKLATLTNAYSKMQTKGKATMEELNMVTEAGVPILQALADSLGVSVASVFDLSSKGKIAFSDVQTAMASLTSETGQFNKGMEKLSETTGGKLSTALDNIKISASEFGVILLPAINDILEATTKLFQGFSELDDGTKRAVLTFAGLTAGIAPAILAVTNLGKAFKLLSTPTGGIGLALIAISAIVAGIQKIEASNLLKSEENFKSLEGTTGRTAKELNQINKEFALMVFQGNTLSDSEKNIQKQYGITNSELVSILAVSKDLYDTDLEYYKALDAVINKTNTKRAETKKTIEETKVAVSGLSDKELESYIAQNEHVQEIINANKTKIEQIDEEIESITTLGLKEGKLKEDQLTAVKILQEQKKVILDEEAQAKEDALLAELTAQQAFDAETRAILEKARTDKSEADKKAHDDYIALKTDEAQFIQDTATSIAGIISNFNTQEITDINRSKDAEIAKLDETLLGTEEYNKQKTKIEKESALKVWEIENKQFRIKQALSLSQIAIDTAVGVAKVWGQTGIFGLGAQIPVIAMGVAQAGLVLSQQSPQKPQLATGAYISGSQRGTEVIVGENGSDEEIFGMGTAGIPRRKQLANEVADVVLSKLRTSSGTVVNNYYQSLFSTASPSDLRKFNRINRPYAVAEEQRIGARS